MILTLLVVKYNKEPIMPLYIVESMDLPSFDGRLHIEDFLDWVHIVRNFFNYLSISEENQVKLVAYKLKDGAFAWWKQLQYNRQ